MQLRDGIVGSGRPGLERVGERGGPVELAGRRRLVVPVRGDPREHDAGVDVGLVDRVHELGVAHAIRGENAQGAVDYHVCIACGVVAHKVDDKPGGLGIGKKIITRLSNLLKPEDFK